MPSISFRLASARDCAAARLWSLDCCFRAARSWCCCMLLLLYVGGGGVGIQLFAKVDATDATKKMVGMQVAVRWKNGR